MQHEHNVSWAMARTMKAAGVGLATCVPGHGCSDFFELLRDLASAEWPYSLHEEVAFTLAHGAALAGMRSTAILKAHGLAKAANSVLDALACGVTAGCVIVIPDDPEAKSSDGILDVGLLCRGLALPMRLAATDSIVEDTIAAFETSEALGLPVALTLDGRQWDRTAGDIVRPCLPMRSDLAYERDVAAHVVCPVMAGYQRKVLDAKLATRTWHSVDRPVLPIVPEGLPPKWQSAAFRYAPLFAVLRRVRMEGPAWWIAGDTGMVSLFAFPPFDCVDVCTYMGGSLPLALGALLAGQSQAWAVTGDWAFVADGRLGLEEAIIRGLPLKLLILDNGISEATGGQAVPPGALDRALAAYMPLVRHIANPCNPVLAEAELRAAADSDELRILVADFRA